MVMPGEGGTGKSRTIQAITRNFHHLRVGHTLVKSAYTGIAASLIDGKTLHIIAQIPVNNGKRSQKGNRKLTTFWSNKQYLIIDKMLMVACHILAKVSAAVTTVKLSRGMEDRELPFGGVNVILVGDFHQFPPVGGKPLYWQLDSIRKPTCSYRLLSDHLATLEQPD